MSKQPQAEAQILEQAIQLAPSSGRNAYLDEACGSDPALRERLDGLIDGFESCGGILDRPAANALIEATEAFPFEAPEEAPGTLIDRYKLLEKIGEGGFGSVYLAEQQEPVVRKVALKVIKAGMDTRQVVARFESERQALALMEHPNIARVLDGGATSSGRPYFVMELVTGEPITDYCRENKLTLRERIELFLPVCQAVQHAHQKGIIHRDLKPSNVMVSLDDPSDAGIPKVIDFGVSKAIGQRLTEHTVFTHHAHVIGTPAYMSPEQAGMDGPDTDTRSDIYSLGVLLYELLTGTTPHDSKRLASVPSGEMQRIIREEDPPRPSARLRAINAEQAHHARGERTLLGDLDWVVMKAIDKDPQRRYETVSALAEDLRRHLAHEPVSAAAPSIAYRLGKFVRRHRVGTIASTAVAVAILTGLGASTWLFLREREARQETEQAIEVLQAILGDIEQSVAFGQYTTELATIIDRASERIDAMVERQPLVAAEVRHSLGNIIEELGETERAAEMVGRSLREYRALRSDDDPLLVGILLDYAFLREDLGDKQEALRLNEEALALTLRVNGQEHPDTVRAMSRLIVSYSLNSRRAEALAMQDEALALARAVHGSDHPRTLQLQANIGGSYAIAKDFKTAAMELEKLLPAWEKQFGARSRHMAKLLNHIADYHLWDGQPEASLPYRLRACELSPDVYGPASLKPLETMRKLARTHEAAGQTAEAARVRAEIERLQTQKDLRSDPFGRIGAPEKADRSHEAVP